MRSLDRWRALLPGLWAGLLLAVALLGTPSAFALLPQAEAGRVAGRMLAVEAQTSLAFGALLLALERVAAKRAAGAGGGSQFSTGMVLAGLALLCTVAGYFALQPMMVAAREGRGPLGFAALHTISAGFYGVKLLAVLLLAWRATRAAELSRRPSS
jgi:hypothetical protein